MASNPQQSNQNNEEIQATIKLVNDSVLAYRKVLIRYFLKLVQNKTIKITRKDYDFKSRLVILNDERKPFDWKVPADQLYKSSVDITINKKTFCVNFILYTTHTGRIQYRYISLYIVIY